MVTSNFFFPLKYGDFWTFCQNKTPLYISHKTFFFVAVVQNFTQKYKHSEPQMKEL
jgi:hypothetical protein